MLVKPKLHQTLQICLDPLALSSEKGNGSLRYIFKKNKTTLIRARSNAQTHDYLF